MHARSQERSSMGKSLLLGLLAIVGLGLVSACLYFSRSPKPWQWGPQQAGTPIGPRPYYGIEEQNRMIEAIYQETQAAQNEELAKLQPTEFSEGIAIMSNDDRNWKLKYIWDYFMPVYNCPLKEKIGIAPRLGDNGKWLCGVRTLLQKDNCVVYSFGSNGETSFEQDLLSKTGCEIHIFDPTLSPELLQQVRSIKGVTVHTYGLGPADGEVQLTDNRQSMSKGFASFTVKSLETIMRELGHSWVDVLKIDIEGAEWPVLKALVKSKKPLPFTQLQVEYHYFHQTNITVPREMLAVLQGLQARDLRVFHVEPNYWWQNYAQEFVEYAYIQVGKVGEVVTGPPAYARKLGRVVPSA